MNTTQPKNDRALIFAKDLDAVQEIQNDNCKKDENGITHSGASYAR
jgi:hypothetical protein